MDIQAILDRRARAWEARDAAALATDYADDAELTSPMFAKTQGRDKIERTFASLYRAFPDWEMVLEPACITGTRAMQPCRIRATHVGEFMGIPGTGRRVEFDCVLIMDFRDGQIVRERRVYDFTGLLIQAGILRPKAG